MKKLFYLFLMMPMALLMSCKDDKIADVDMTLTLDGVTFVDNNFYTVAGNEVTIESLEVDPVGGKSTSLANVQYFLSGAPIIGMPGEEGLSFSTEDLEAGTYNINVTGNLLQVDSSIQIFAANYSLTIVESDDDLPAGAPEIGTYSQTLRVN